MGLFSGISVIISERSKMIDIVRFLYGIRDLEKLLGS
jgi:hypothetical protein